MTAEIARRTENLPVEYISERPMRLVEWAEEARAAHALAEALCQTPFAGAYAGNPGGATAAILKGAEVGLTPVTALGSFDLIQGTPAPKALTLRALVQSHGHRVWIESSTDAECIAKAVRRGESEVHVSKWTIKRAQLMNLTGKKNWKEQPAAMLMARATSEVCRLVAADVRVDAAGLEVVHRVVDAAVVDVDARARPERVHRLDAGVRVEQVDDRRLDRVDEGSAPATLCRARPISERCP
jgi:hypothetical protein